MQRLELPSKIKNVFKYGKEEKGHTFDVVLVMNEVSSSCSSSEYRT